MIRKLLLVDFYVYLHCKPDGTPFYVGKGTRARAYSLSGRNLHHANIVKKYGKENIIIDLLSCADEEEAFEQEQLFILLLREDGLLLANKSDGGEGGATGFKASEATCEKHRQFKHSEENKILFSLQKLGNKYGVGNRGKIKTPEQRHAAGNGRRGKSFGPPSKETRRKIGDANRGRKFPPHTEERCRKISEGLKRAYQEGRR
jgi:hypothetical protein